MIPTSTQPNLWRYRMAAIVLVFFSVLMSAQVSSAVFERLPHLEDEVAYLYQAKIFAGGHLVVSSPTPHRSYWQPFVVDYAPSGNRFGKYTPGWPALLALGVLAGQPWIINALLAGLSVALVFRLGTEVFNPDVGLIAAALTAFSPMALLLNGSLMGHTAAFCFVMLFAYAFWRMGKGRHVFRWGLVAGLALGVVVDTRPLTAIGIALPFVLWSGFRLLALLIRERQRFLPVLKPLLALSAVTLVLSAAIPIFNDAATGNPTLNLYTLVWSYDRIGYGPCCGRHGHTLGKGIAQARFDLSLTAADLFGWQLGPITPELEDHLLNDSDYYPDRGYSWVLLLPGLLAGVLYVDHRRKIPPEKQSRITMGPLTFTILWLVGAAFWILLPILEPSRMTSDFVFIPLWWSWLAVAGLWLGAPFAYALVTHRSKTFIWTWLLADMALALVGVHLLYWIGSQRYSTRYYFEALGAVAIISALPLAWLARRGWRKFVYAGLAIVLAYSFFNYSIPRVSVLYRFNYIGQNVLDGVQQRRQGDTPVLVIVNGTVTNTLWRSMGTLMAVTSPYLDSDIVVAWDYQSEGVRDQILARFPDRQIIEMNAEGNQAWFADEPGPGG